MATLREKLNNNPQYVTIGTIVIIVIAIVAIYFQLRPTPPLLPAGNSSSSAQVDAQRAAPANPGAEAPAENQEQPAPPAEAQPEE